MKQALGGNIGWGPDDKELECSNLVSKVMKNHQSILKGKNDLVRFTCKNICCEALKLVLELGSHSFR
jgi:hypothetical protein